MSSSLSSSSLKFAILTRLKKLFVLTVNFVRKVLSQIWFIGVYLYYLISNIRFLVGIKINIISRI